MWLPPKKSLLSITYTIYIHHVFRYSTFASWRKEKRRRRRKREPGFVSEMKKEDKSHGSKKK